MLSIVGFYLSLKYNLAPKFNSFKMSGDPNDTYPYSEWSWGFFLEGECSLFAYVNVTCFAYYKACLCVMCEHDMCLQGRICTLSYSTLAFHYEQYENLWMWYTIVKWAIKWLEVIRSGWLRDWTSPCDIEVTGVRYRLLLLSHSIVELDLPWGD